MKFTPAAVIVLVLLAFGASRYLSRTPSPGPYGTLSGSTPAPAFPSPAPFAIPHQTQPPTFSSSSSPPGVAPPPSLPATLPPPSPAERAFVAFDQWLQHHAARLPQFNASDAAASEAEGLRLARRRREELEDLIRSDPRRALELALPDEIRASLPASILAWIEQRVSGRGDFEVLCALPEPGRESEVQPLQRYAVIDGRRFTAFVYGRRLTQPTLRNVSLHGIAIDEAMAVAERPVRELAPAVTRHLLASQPDARCAEDPEHPVSHPLALALEAYGRPVLLCCPEHADRFETRLAAAGTGNQPESETDAPLAASSATEGLKRLLFIRVDFSDLTGESFSTDRATNLTRELHRFYQDNSYGRAGFFEIGAGSAVTPVLRMPRTAASYGSNDDAGDLRNDARTAARNAGYVLSNYDYDITCLRSVAGFGWAGLGFVGAPGSWIRGTSSTGVTAHELGHNFGLNHANFWDTGGASITGAGEDIEYGDKFDTMGAANAGNNHFNARYKRMLGWLRTGEFTVVSTNGTYRLHAHDQTNAIAGSRGLQIFTNARTNYWVEFRQRFTGNRWLLNGVGLRWAGRGNESSLLLDTTPGTSREKDDASIVLGRTFTDADTGIHITPIAKGGSNPAWIDVAVHRGTFPDNRPPSLQLIAPVVEGTTTTSFEFQAVASDPDGDPLAYSWEFSDESLGSNIPLLTHRWSANGDYLVQCTASDLRGGTARASVLIRVGSPSTLRLSGRITADGEPVSGVRVSASGDRLAYTDSSGRFTLTGLGPGSYSLNAVFDRTAFEPVTFTNPVTVQADRSDLDFAAVDVVQRRTVTLLPAGSSWSYWDRGTSPESTWIQADFDDSGWNVGPAILGYGGDRETTVVDFGSDASRKYITTWYRRSFSIADPSRLANVRIGLLRDDGAAVYLNGQPLYRDNLPGGTLSAQTLASSTVGGSAETTYFERDIDPAQLLAGDNLLAVEVHQASVSSSDSAFDLRLTADLLQTLEPGIRLVRPGPDDSFLTPGRLVLSAAVGELPSSPLQRIEFLADGQVIGIATQPPYTITWINPPPGEPTLTARAILPEGAILDSEPVITLVRDANLSPVVIPRGSVWRYLDTGVAPDAAWNGLAFDDSSWSAGPARLGYGEDGEFTVVNFGPNPSQRHVTTWFRHSFHLEDAETVTNLVCRLVRDDGAVVYLNGQELFRSGIRTGSVTPSLLASSEIRDDGEVTFIERNLAPTALVEGRNILAVEVHQVSRSSSDLGFDLEWVAQRSALPEAPRLSVRLVDGQFRLSWPLRFPPWRLEFSPALGPDATWQPAPGTAAVENSESTVTLPISEGTVFYRLTRP